MVKCKNSSLVHRFWGYGPSPTPHFDPPHCYGKKRTYPCLIVITLSRPRAHEVAAWTWPMAERLSQTLAADLLDKLNFSDTCFGCSVSQSDYQKVEKRIKTKPKNLCLIWCGCLVGLFLHFYPYVLCGYGTTGLPTGTRGSIWSMEVVWKYPFAIRFCRFHIISYGLEIIRLFGYGCGFDMPQFCKVLQRI